MKFLLLLLRILLNLSSDISYKQYEFSKTLPEKSLEFILSSENSTIAYYLSLILLHMEVNLILEK